jgi:hypothetical protein
VERRASEIGQGVQCHPRKNGCKFMSSTIPEWPS